MARSNLFAVRKELPTQVRLMLVAFAFVLPLVAWSIVSYVPFVWHPLVLVENAGDTSVAGSYSYVEVGQLIEKEAFDARNLELAKAGAKLARGTPANPIYLPAPHEVARAFYTAFTTAPERTGDKWLHESLWHSCRIIFAGFFYAAILGVPLGILCGTFGFFSKLFEPFVDFVRYMPAPVFGALAVAVVGLEDEPKIAIIFIGTFFQMVLVVANTTRQLDLALLEAGQTLGAKNRQLLRYIVIPGILPRLYQDMRILIGWAWTYLVVAELIGEKSGISAFLYQQQRYRHFDNVYASIIMIGMIGLLTDQVLAFVGGFLFPWEGEGTGVARWLKSKLAKRAQIPKEKARAQERLATHPSPTEEASP